MKRHVGTGTFKATDQMKSLIASILDSGQISYGEVSKAFEKRFAEIHGSQYGILSNSGTSSLQVALQAMVEIHHWERGGQVIVPATTFVATPNIVKHNGLLPVFVDVDPVTYNMDVDKLKDVVNKDTKAIIPVHLFGQPANMSKIMDFADNYGLKVIEDSCETMFVSHRDRVVGSWGDIGCFSLYVAHLVVAGVGGVSVTSDPRYAAKMRSLVNHGLTMDNLNPGENFQPQPMLGRKFMFDSVGHSYRITEFEAALALSQLHDPMKNIVEPRQRNAELLTEGLQELNRLHGEWFQTPEIAHGNDHAFMMYPIVLKQGGEDRKVRLTAYLNANGIETRDMLPLIGQPIYKHDLDGRRFPVSNLLVTNGFYIGCHQDLDYEDMSYVIGTIGSWLDLIS